jgi:hypothetical protein
VAAQHDEAAVAAVAGERDQHRGQRHGERETAGDLDVGAEQQHDRGDEQFANPDAHDRGDDADEEPGDHCGDKGRGGGHEDRVGPALGTADGREVAAVVVGTAAATCGAGRWC